jgi:hypothetical protein
MGWNPFRSKYKTYVGTSVSRVIEDDVLPDTVKTAVIRALNANTDPLDEVMEDMLGSLGPRVDRMFRYAQNGNYTFGLPSTQIHLASEAIAQVEGVLEAIEGAQVSIEYSQFGTINLLHLGWTALLAQQNYNPDTNELPLLSTAKGTPVYLADMIVLVPLNDWDKYNRESFNQYGTTPKSGPCPGRVGNSYGVGLYSQHSPVERSYEITDEIVRVFYRWMGTKQVDGDNGPITIPDVKEESLDILLGPLADNLANYFHVKYVVNGVTKYWLYEYGSGTYPILDAVFESGHTALGTFYPWTYFRWNKVNQADGNLAHFASTKKMLKYLGMDYVEMAASINENPDIGDVEQAILTMAIPANSTDPVDIRYLFEFFKQLHGNAGTQYTSGQQANANDALDEGALRIQDGRFVQHMNFSGIYRRTITGKLGPVGTYQSASGVENIGPPYQVTETTQSGDNSVTTTITVQDTAQFNAYRFQDTDTTYTEIKVHNLSIAFQVLDGYYATALENDIPVQYVPLDWSIASTWSAPDRETLYARSLHFIFNSVQVVKIRWYQQAWFKFVLIIVAVVICIVSLGSASGPMAALVAAIAAGSAAAITAALIALMVDLLIGLLIGLVLKWFVKVVGIKNAFILAVVMVVASFVAPELGISSIQGCPWATELLQAGAGLARAITDELGDLMKGLSVEALEFGNLVDKQAEELKKANDLLDTSDNYLDPFIVWGESPTDFFNRTVHSGNIGTIGISAISAYVENALKLPELTNTLGESP